MKTKIMRIDSIPDGSTFFTEQGFLRDTPIVTSTGIFEYDDGDGGIRRELRLPDDVFDEKSLASYEGKPVIITHDAGLIDKDNVMREMVGTIISKGMRDGDDVRCNIVIHDINKVKRTPYRDLSLGYTLDLEETPGEWNGEHYDAIQKNIRINHLAIVDEARAGEQAHLNLDGKNVKLGHKKIKGGTMMKRNSKRKGVRTDGILTPEELKKAVEEYKARRGNRLSAKADEEEQPKGETGLTAQTDDEEGKVGVSGGEPSVEEQVQLVKDRRTSRDENGDPASLEEANGVIANQDEDINTLFDIIDTLLAQMAFDDEDANNEETDLINQDDAETVSEEQPEDAPVNEDSDEENTEEAEVNEDDDDDDIPTTDPGDIPEGAVLNADGIDKIVRERVQIATTAALLNMDGLESCKPMRAKKTIIKAVRPDIRLDGKSKAYIDALFDLSCKEVQKRSRKDTMYQRKQMFNKDGRRNRSGDTTEDARNRMIKRMQNKK